MKKIQFVDSVLHSKRLCLFLLAFCLLAVFLVSFALGHYDVSLRQVMGILCNALLGPLTGGRLMLPSAWTDTMQIAVLNIRLPRILMACMVGCCLSAAGCAGFSHRAPCARAEGGQSDPCGGHDQLAVFGRNLLL